MRGVAQMTHYGVGLALFALLLVNDQFTGGYVIMMIEAS